MTSADFFPPIRRVVTGHDDEGRSRVVSDGAPPVHARKDPDTVTATVWATQGRPRLNEPGDGALLAQGLPPPPQGARFGVLDLAPGRQAPGLHRTETIDFAVCVAGEITLTLDREEVILRPGDTVVQRGTLHGWSNRGDRPARLVFVLMDAEPFIASQ